VLSAPVFILGIHKSGTSLLRSLLDGTPGLAVFPREPHFFEHVGLGVHYPLRSSLPSDLSQSAFLDRVATTLRKELKDNPYSDSPHFSGYDVDCFLKEGWRDGPETLASQYERYVDALWRSIAETPLGDLRVVDKSTEYLEFAMLLSNLFADASFLHIVRNPYAVLVSYRSYKLKHARRYPDLRLFGQALSYGAYWQFRNEATIPAYTVIRYEDLARKPAETMQRAADSIGLDYHEALTVPTLLGEHWAGNSTSDTAFSGVSADRLDAWRDDIKPTELKAVNAALPDAVFSRLGYERLPTPSRRQTLRPNRGEGRRLYLRNRML
jgi:protein-tyrosine sulfotransferase